MIADQLLHELNFESEASLAQAIARCVYRSTGTNEARCIQDFPYHPLIFIAYCFGGLVVLQVCRRL